MTTSKYRVAIDLIIPAMSSISLDAFWDNFDDALEVAKDLKKDCTVYKANYAKVNLTKLIDVEIIANVTASGEVIFT